MKTKKLFLPTVILIVAILLTAIYSVVSSIAFKPTITEAEFPFSITYEIDGETVVINDVYKAYYVGNSGYADSKYRCYEGDIINRGEDTTIYTLKKGENTRVELWTHFYADYLMGDSEYDYFDDEAFEPKIYYYDSEENEYHDEETLMEQGVKLISWEYPTPIENKLVFSHISYLNGAVVLPIVFIALLALLAIIIFVKKDKEHKYKVIDFISIALNVIISLTVIPFVAILAFFIDIEGGGPELYYQLLYFIPSVSILSIAASVGLRKKGYRKSSLITQFIGPVIFGIYIIVFYVFGYLMG